MNGPLHNIEMLPSLNILQISYENADSEKIILVVSEFGRLLF